MNPSDALALNLKSKMCIEELELGWSMNRDTTQNDKDVLEKLQPYNNLKSLSISCYGGVAFPYWFADHSLSNLVSLVLSNCKNCVSLPSLGLLLPSLVFLSFSGMEAWEEWECENTSGAFSRLQIFSIVKCPKLKEHLPDELLSLRKLVIEDCEQLVASIPKAPCLGALFLRNCGKLQLESLPSTLKFLRIGGILPENFSAEKFDNAIANTRLEILFINDCAYLEFPLLHRHNFLVNLRIERSCNSLKAFSLDLFPMLQHLELTECSNLETIYISGENHRITELWVKKCPKFESFPNERCLAAKLACLIIGDLESLKSLPDGMHILFPSLERLTIDNCPQVESFPEGGLPSTLKSIGIYNCPKLMAAQGLHSLASLERLSISDSDAESLPNEGLLLSSSLVSLGINNSSNLRTLNHRGLCHLNALVSLYLEDCPKLQKLPKEGLPNTLSTLYIRGCPLLEKCCQKSQGKYWDKISHIPTIQIGSDIVT